MNGGLAEREEGAVHLVMDVGNTETLVGIFEGAPEGEGLPPPGTDPEDARRGLEVLGHGRLSSRPSRTPDEMGLLLRSLLEARGVEPRRIRRVVVGSVVPSLTEVIREAWEVNRDPPVVVVESTSPLPIRLDVEEPRTVGADRVVNTLAASVLYGRDTITVDLGTATTYDCITADGVFQGGVIAPGIRAGQEWLSGRTAKLPPVELRPPERVIGRRTEDCLHSGIFYAAVDAVDGMVRRIRREWGRPDPLVVATGGYASRIALHSECVERVEPLLTLYGLELAGRHMAALERVD